MHKKDTYNLAIGLALQELHNEQKLPREKIAEALELSELDVTRIEHGSETLSAGSLVLLLELFDVTWDDFIHASGPIWIRPRRRSDKAGELAQMASQRLLTPSRLSPYSPGVTFRPTPIPLRASAASSPPESAQRLPVPAREPGSGVAF